MSGDSPKRKGDDLGKIEEADEVDVADEAHHSKDAVDVSGPNVAEAESNTTKDDDSIGEPAAKAIESNLDEGNDSDGGSATDATESGPTEYAVTRLTLQLLTMKKKMADMERLVQRLDRDSSRSRRSISHSRSRDSEHAQPRSRSRSSSPDVVRRSRVPEVEREIITVRRNLHSPPPRAMAIPRARTYRSPPRLPSPRSFSPPRSKMAPHYIQSQPEPVRRRPVSYRPPVVINNKIYNDYSSDEDVNIRFTNRLGDDYDAPLEQQRRVLRELQRRQTFLDEDLEDARKADLARAKDEEAEEAAASSPQAVLELRASRRGREAKRRFDLIDAEEKRKDNMRAIERAQNLHNFLLDTVRADHAEGGAESLQDDASASAEQGPRMLVPALYLAPWKVFRSVENYFTLEPLAAIDVLQGNLPGSGLPPNYKPASDEDADMESFRGMGRLKSRPSFPLKALSGQEPLPERIRIRDSIVHFLGQVGGSQHNKPFARILLRPYRRLVHNDQAIRSCWRYWADHFGVQHDRGSHVEDEFVPGRFLKIAPKSASEVRYLGCLLDFMDEYIEPKLQWVASPECDKITFVDLWYLFKPGDFVIGDSGRQVYRVLSIASTGHRASSPYRDYTNLSNKASERLDMPFRILCTHIDFNGRDLGPVTTEFTIKKYDGEKAISSFVVQPARFDQNPDRKEKFIKRGKRFLRAAAVQHLHYAGHTINTMDEVDSQVVIDFAECLSTLGSTPWSGSAVGIGAVPPAFETCDEVCCRDDYIDHDEGIEMARDEIFMASLLPPVWTASKLPSVTVYPRSLEEANTDENRIVDEEYLIMSYRVYGFILNTRKWAQLDLDFLRPVGGRRDDDSFETKQEQIDREMGVSFDQLVLPKGHKEMVLSLVAQHYRNKEMAFSSGAQFDIVRGKGKGLILLLHGAPGVGKTSTAECVAERFDKPLFQITCGDLGTTAKEVEGALERNFSLANKWGCILLLDEADVFLARRTSNDFARNGLVAVFLRILEYYAGILFLTTNRVGDFDEAFTSRIHISLNYPALDEDSTDSIFEVNLNRIKNRFANKGRKLDLDEVKIRMFARTYWRDNPKARWNGRQIRNACQTALALSEFEAQGGMSTFENAEVKYDTKLKDTDAVIKLGVRDFETVAAAYLSFIKYLDDIYGADSETRAKESFLRAIYKDVAGGAGVPNLNISQWASNGSGWRHLGEGAPSMSSQTQHQGLAHQQHHHQQQQQQPQQQHHYSQYQQPTQQHQQQPHQHPGHQVYGQHGQGFSSPPVESVQRPNATSGPTTGFSAGSQDGFNLLPGTGTYQQPGQQHQTFAPQFQGHPPGMTGSHSAPPAAQNMSYPGQLGGTSQ